ncbi:MAG: protein kinase [Planctomycetales bacterium]|nr:protein kinase [Planctomycetales bacterium]
MKNCPGCQALVDEASLAAGHCAHCGAILRDIPRRSVQDIQATVEKEPPVTQQPGVLDELDTIDPADLVEEASPKSDPDTIQTMEFDIGEFVEDRPEAIEELVERQGTPTVSFGGEKTIELTTEIDPDVSESMVTAQWLDNVAGSQSGAGATDPGATIRQKETITGSFVSKSSLIVKSRHFRSEKEAGQPVASAAEAPDYELINIIGEGGMGVVYAARQSAIARTVAVKMLKQADGQSNEQREKFISEAVVTGELDHPNIVPIYDLGANDSGALFYSMKRVRGTPWNDVLKERPLEENLNILLRVADAVAFAHANGVLHRDLKPENVMLGDFGEVLVMDWGLARISPEFPNAASVTQSDVMGGTPAYMAPEMATGPIDQITIASDIYLLGAILFEVITGRPPHTGKTVMACLFSAAKNQIVSTDHTGELMDIALLAMATAPTDRYATVQDFQSAIRQYQSHSESVLLTDSAAKNLAAAQEADDYDLFSRALYGFQEALALWRDNRRAQDFLSTAQMAYANSALGRGDFDLGISLLDAGNDQHRELLERLESGRRERESRHRRVKILKATVAGLVVAVVGIVSVAYVAVRTQRDKAIEAEAAAVVARDQAVKSEAAAVAARDKEAIAKQEAEVARDRAVKSEAEAVAARDKEEIARIEAVAARDQEEIARKEAIVARDRAIEAEQIAKLAKEAEEYEAYVARIGLASAKIDENAFDRAVELLDECPADLCHWEWGRLAYLTRLSSRDWNLEGPVEAVAFSPDGTLLASGDFDGKAKLWDRQTGEMLHTLSHGQYVHTVAFDAAGKRLATGSSDRTIHIYAVEDGALLHTLAGHTDAVLSARFSSDGRRLLSSGYDNTARIWDLETGQLEQTLQGHSWWVWRAEFSPDGQRIVTASQDGKAIVWELRANGQYEILTEFTKHRGPVYAAQFSPDGTTVATAGDDRRVLLWNPDEVQPVDIARRLDQLSDPPAPFRELAVHDGPVRALVFSPDGSQLVSGGQDNVLRVWDLTSDRETAVLRGHASQVRDCAFSPDGQWLLSAGRDRQMKIWQPQLYGESLHLGKDDAVGHADAVLDARFSRAGDQIVTASRDRTAALWDVAGQQLLKRFSEGHEFLASSARFFAGGDRLATGAGDGTTRIWDVASKTEILKLPSTGRTAALGVSDEGHLIVTGSDGNDAVVWDTHSGEQVAVLAGHEAAITAAQFSPGAQWIATGDDRGRCRLWRHEGDQWIGSAWLLGHSRSITAMAFSRDGQRLITSSGDNTCGQWDVATGRELKELVLSHPEWVSDMDVSDDGKLALTCCDDGSLRLWSLVDAKVLRTIEPTEDVAFTSVDLSPDGQLAMAACAADGTVRMWRLETGEEIVDRGQAWLNFGRGGTIWAARFDPVGDHVLTVGGNDARLWELPTRAPQGRFSPHGTVAAADISPNGKFLVTGSWDQSVKIWDIESGQAIRKLEGVHNGYVNSVEFSPDGALVLTGSDDGTARLWEAATGKASAVTFRGHESRIRQARFSHDGQRVLTSANDKTARIWDARSGQLQLTLEGHVWGVLCGEFSSDGQRVVTGSEDNTAIVWDANTGQPLLKLAGHIDGITAVAFSPDGKRVLTGSEDNTAKLWDAQTGKEILTLLGHEKELTSVSFSPDSRFALTAGRDGMTLLWPTTDWRSLR